MINYKISKLQATNFRNLNPDIIEFCPGINCIVGENGNGKTNILEALNVVATKKSFRKNTSFPQILSVDGEKPEIIISAIFQDDHNNSHSLSTRMDDLKSEWSYDGKVVKKLPAIKTIFINPFDSYAFHNQASFRRAWFDQHLSKMSNEYKKVLNKYTSSLRFRNSLLSKKPAKFREQVIAIDEQLAVQGVYITRARQEFIHNLRNYCGETFKNIFSEEHDLEIQLDSRVAGQDEKYFKQLLTNNLERDALIGHTSYGIHKDDYVLLFDGMNSFEFCSLGQQKMSYLSLLFAYIELFRYNFNSFPIVLIDDVSGELDRLRWKRLVDYLRERTFQVLITTANEKFKEELETIEGAKQIRVSAGLIS